MSANSNKDSIVIIDDYRSNEQWRIYERRIDPVREREVESLFSFCNGYIGTRDSLEEYYSFCDPVSLMSGFYTYPPNCIYNELAVLPDWTRIQIYIEDEEVTIYNYKTLSHIRYLDIYNGIVCREWKVIDTFGRITTIKIQKFISISQKHVATKSLMIKPENYSGKIRVRTGLDGNIVDPYISKLDSRKCSNHICYILKTINEERVAVISQKSEFAKEGTITILQPYIRIPLSPQLKDQIIYQHGNYNGFLYEEWEWIASIGAKYEINSITLFYSSNEVPDPLLTTNNHLEKLDKDFYQTVFKRHMEKWQLRLDESLIKISDDAHAQRLTNFAIYHLIVSGEFSGNKTSIPARNLNGTAYKGHIFWDTEIYILPFFTFTKPEIARNLLMYRYNTLNAARDNAKLEGFKGACYPWESTDSGLEMTPPSVTLPNGEVIPIYSGKYENHISPDISYAVWQYWIVTNDEEFLVNYGAEIIFETARFCKSLMSKEADGCYHINDVVGPDEYHERVDDNMYTNFLAQYNLEIAVKAAKFLKENHNKKFMPLRQKINLTDEELESWDAINKKIYTACNPKTKVYEQFNGYFNLEYIDLDKYKNRTAPMDIILGSHKIHQSQVIKQADVLMFLFLLATKFPLDIVEANYNYYRQRSGHGSSLSPSIYGIVAARINKIEDAYNYFKENAEIDLNDNMGNASGGVHIASMGGTWMLLTMGFAGMYTYEEGLLFDPHLPEKWDYLEYSLIWRSQKLNIKISNYEFILHISGPQKIKISIGFDNWRELEPNHTYNAYKSTKWNWKG